ncbi:hypothetical protein M7I_2662 [Glarea lozoyensis 74030]|uniref:Uncharacterized protein n=1 Tax=Glarea lozoyensis (strain ATCC 74030 / MF5533) TaxID=1104152 RepID=H0EJD6_GLAL7|nr:hypothetical protein M7I_2662 [Glarea lozoyensis 74030]
MRPWGWKVDIFGFGSAGETGIGLEKNTARQTSLDVYSVKSRGLRSNTFGKARRMLK